MAKHGSAKEWAYRNLARRKQVERNQKLKKRYGITLDMYAEILASQNGVCAICEYAPSADEKALAVDHCHKTLRIRGLLCQWCNRGLGYFKDNTKVMKKAIEYLTSKGHYGIIKKQRW
jgi:hypothetical protein